MRKKPSARRARRTRSRRRRECLSRAAARARKSSSVRPGGSDTERHRIERRARRDTAHARNRVETLGRDARAFGQRGAERHLMRAVAGQRRGHGVLHRSRTAQPAVRELLHRGQRIVQSRRAADDHPSGAPAWCEIGLRQTRERDDRRVGIERRQAAGRPLVTRGRRRPRRPESSARAARRSR